MLNSILSSSGLTMGGLLICSLASIVFGLIIALVHMKTSKYTKNFLITLIILPILVQTVIFMVNGNLGTSIAIVGAFSLVRFRSVAGTSREIVSIFFAMAIGLATGMGQIVFAAIITIVVSLVLIILSISKFGEGSSCSKMLKITIPENVDYTEVFDDIFDKYLVKSNLESVKTVNLGSLFELTYTVNLKEKVNEKQFIDDLRCRNGNLKIILTHPISDGEL